MKYRWIDMNGFSLVVFFNGISAFEGYLIQKPFLLKNSSDNIQPITRRIRGFIPFPKLFVRK